MFGSNYFGQAYFGQGPAGGGILTSYPLTKLVRTATRFINGIRTSRAIAGFARSTKRLS